MAEVTADWIVVADVGRLYFKSRNSGSVNIFI